MKSEVILAAGLVAMLLLAGCAYFPQGKEVNLGFHGTLNASASGFQMEGNLSTGGGIPDREVYRDVSVKLYSAEGTLLHREDLGSMRTDRKLAVLISMNEIPFYVIFDSPDFWQDSIQVEYYEKFDSKYRVEYTTERAELPIETTSSGDPTNNTPQGGNDGSGVKLEMGRLEFIPDTLQHSDSGFVYEGRIDFELYLSETKSFENAKLCLYDENGSVLNSANVGAFTTSKDRATVSIRAEHPPTYVIVDHPDFRQYTDLEAGVMIFEEDHSYVKPSINYTELDGMLPFRHPRRNETGVCG